MTEISSQPVQDLVWLRHGRRYPDKLRDGPELQYVLLTRRILGAGTARVSGNPPLAICKAGGFSVVSAATEQNRTADSQY